MPMSAPDFLAAATHLPLLSPEALSSLAPVLVIAPHPDDESLACGGLIAALADARLPVRVIVVSDGAASYPGSRTFPPARLRGRREAELLAAMAELGVSARAVSFLGLPDSRVPRAGEPEFAAARTRLAQAAARGASPRTLVTSWRHDPHTDHAAAYELTRALRTSLDPPPHLLEYVVWGSTLPETYLVNQAPAGFRFETAAWRERKQRAIACHRTQLGHVVRDAADGFALPPVMVERCVQEPELFLELPA